MFFPLFSICPKDFDGLVFRCTSESKERDIGLFPSFFNHSFYYFPCLDIFLVAYENPFFCNARAFLVDLVSIFLPYCIYLVFLPCAFYCAFALSFFSLCVFLSFFSSLFSSLSFSLSFSFPSSGSSLANFTAEFMGNKAARGSQPSSGACGGLTLIN